MADEISDRFRPISDEDLEEARRWSIAGNEDNLGGDTIPSLIGRIDTLEAQVATLSTKLAAAQAGHANLWSNYEGAMAIVHELKAQLDRYKSADGFVFGKCPRGEHVDFAFDHEGAVECPGCTLDRYKSPEAIERVAKAIRYDTVFRNPPDNAIALVLSMEAVMQDRGWDDITEEAREMWRSDARAAVLALGEPTP